MSSSSITSTATTRVTTLLDIPTSALDLVLMQHSNTGRQLGQPQMVIGVGPGLCRMLDTNFGERLPSRHLIRGLAQLPRTRLLRTSENTYSTTFVNKSERKAGLLHPALLKGGVHFLLEDSVVIWPSIATAAYADKPIPVAICSFVLRDTNSINRLIAHPTIDVVSITGYGVSLLVRHPPTGREGWCDARHHHHHQ